MHLYNSQYHAEKLSMYVHDIFSQMTYTIIKQSGNLIILQGLKIFLFLHILYIVSFHWLIPYLVLHFLCNWFLCASFYGDTGRNVCMRHSPALHTLLSLYDCTSSITTSCKWYTAGFILENFIISFQSRNDMGSQETADARNKKVISAFFAAWKPEGL